MDFDREQELEDAGIDAFEFSLMDEDERREVLRDNCLDPDDYDMIDLEPEFYAWEKLQRSGLSLNELSHMDDAEKKEALEDAGLDAEDYGVDSGFYHYSYVSHGSSAAKKETPKKEPAKPQTTEESQPAPKQEVRTSSPAAAWTEPPEKNNTRVYRYCGVKLLHSDQVFWFLTGDLALEVGDLVQVPISATNDRAAADVVSVKTGIEKELPFSLAKAKYVCRILKTKDGRVLSPTAQVTHMVEDPKPEEAKPQYVPPVKERRQRRRGPSKGIFGFILLVCAALIIFSLNESPQNGITNASPGTPKPTAAPRPTSKPSPTTSPKIPAVTVAPKPKTDAPYVGMRLSTKNLEYRGTAKVDGKNTTKYQYKIGTKTYEVYLDDNNLVRKAVDVTPSLSAGKSKKKTGSKLPASDYVHPDDFYYDYYDDFDDYEDAEEYWEEYG